LQKALSYLSKKTYIGIDVQHNSVKGYNKATYLELTTDSKGFIINLQHFEDDPTPLASLFKIFTDEKISKVGFNLPADIDAICNCFGLFKTNFKSMLSLEERLFVYKTSYTMNLSKICYRFYGKELHHEKLRKIGERSDVTDYEERKSMMSEVVACFALSKSMETYLSREIPSNKTLLAGLKIDKSWHFVLDQTCPCCLDFFLKESIPHRLLRDPTYQSSPTVLIQHSKPAVKSQIQYS